MKNWTKERWRDHIQFRCECGYIDEKWAVQNVAKGIKRLRKKAVDKSEEMRTPRFMHEYLAEYIEKKFGIVLFE